MSLTSGWSLPDRLDQPQAVLASQPQIQQHDLRLQLLYFLQHIVAIADGCQDLQVLLPADHGRQAFPEQPVVLDKDE